MWRAVPRLPEYAQATQEREIARIRDGRIVRGPRQARAVPAGEEVDHFVAFAARALEWSEPRIDMDAHLWDAFGADELQVYEIVQAAEEVWGVELMPATFPVEEFPARITSFTTLLVIVTRAESGASPAT